MGRKGQASEAVTAMVIGVAVGLFTTVSLLLGVWIAAPFFAPLLLIVLAASVAAARSAAKRLHLPGLGWSRIVLLAFVSWPLAAALPYAALVFEANLRIEFPPLPPDATNVSIRATPLSGGSMRGPAPGIVAEYWTPRSQEEARSDLASRLPVPVNFQDERLYAIPDPHQALAVATPEGSGTRIQLGVYSDYTSALPWLMFLAGWGWIVIVFLTRPPKPHAAAL